MKTVLLRTVRRALRSFGYEISRSPGRQHHAFDHTFDQLAALRDIGFDPKVICDVGASDGRWTRSCLRIFPEARYFCIEPLAEHRESLNSMRARNSRVSHWEGCLGSGLEKAVFHADGDGSSLLPGHKGNPYGEQRNITVETLDRLVQSGVCTQPDLIKLDVQGYELKVLYGATQSLSEAQAVIAELSFFQFQSGMPLFHELVGYLAEREFVVADLLALSLRPLDQNPAQCDALFLKRGHPLRCDNRWSANSVY